MKPFNGHNPIIGRTIKNGQIAMHGDVLVFGEEIPKDFDNWPIVKDSCLAYGESTGHAHQLVGGEFYLRENPKTKERHLRVVTSTMLKHQEHRPIEINPGEYRIGIQREYDPFEKLIRNVED